jgi:hypothetical protein
MKGTRKITATTPVGTFTRRTARTYSHVIVEFETAAYLEANRLLEIARWEKANLTAAGEQRLAELLVKPPITEGRYTAISWVGRPDLVAARLNGTKNTAAYQVDGTFKANNTPRAW